MTKENWHPIVLMISFGFLLLAWIITYSTNRLDRNLVSMAMYANILAPVVGTAYSFWSKKYAYLGFNCVYLMVMLVVAYKVFFILSV